MIAHATLMARIQEIIESNTTPAFAQVFAGEPLGLPLGGPFAAFWYLGRTEMGQTLRGQINLIERYQVMAWWPRQPERATLEAFENEIADADQSLHTAFRADATLNGGSTPTLTISDSQVSYGGFPVGNQVMYRALEFELQIKDAEAEGTTP